MIIIRKKQKQKIISIYSDSIVREYYSDDIHTHIQRHYTYCKNNL